MRWLLVRWLLMLSVLWAPDLARADAEVFVVARGDDGVFRSGPVQARLGAPIELGIAIADGRSVWAPGPVALGRRRRVGDLPEGTTVRWLRVEPEREHVALASPNPGLASFSNAVLTGPRHGEWIGVDVLEYRESLLGGAGIEIAGDRASVRAAHPTDPRWDRNRGAGSIWIAAEVTLADGTVLRTPGVEAVDRLGLRPEVMRLSFRTGDDYLGWLSTYFNVPDVFGSLAAQVERYTGADCADVLVAGRRREGASIPYVSVAGLSRVADARSDLLVIDDAGHVRLAAEPERALRWGDDVAPGDLVTIDYGSPGAEVSLPRAWDHIGALVSDDGDGELDGGDVLRHMGHMGLSDQPLAAHGPARLRIFRFR